MSRDINEVGKLMYEIQFPAKVPLTDDLTPDLGLTHGSALIVLQRMGFAEGVSPDTFNHYVKSIRKLGAPFPRHGPTVRAGKPALYSYNHMMELCIALTLRVYGVLPDSVLVGLIRFRYELYGLYRRAYLECRSDLGTPFTVAAGDKESFAICGVYLDLRIRFGAGHLLEFGPPRVVSPVEALRLYAQQEAAGRAHLPFNLSKLAVRLVEETELAPRIRRGPH